MRAKCIPGHRLVLRRILLDALYNRVQVLAELRTNDQQVRNPSDRRGYVLQGVGTHRYAERTGAIADWLYPPRYSRLATARPADLEVVTDALDPVAKAAFIDPATEIVNLIP